MYLLSNPIYVSMHLRIYVSIGYGALRDVNNAKSDTDDRIPIYLSICVHFILTLLSINLSINLSIYRYGILLSS
jgi:hypothetical protein